MGVELNERWPDIMYHLKVFPLYGKECEPCDTSARIMKHNAFSLLSKDFSLSLRSAMPFGGGMASKRVIPVIGFEAVESQNLPAIALENMCRRPNFNRAPRGWGADYSPESNEL